MKIFLLFFLFFIALPSVFAGNDLEIISRAEWGANEEYRFSDSEEWQNIFDQWEKEEQERENKTIPQWQIDAWNKKQAKEKEMDRILLEEFGHEIEIDSKVRYENGRKLAWPVEKTKQVKAIVVHHTHSEYSSSLDGVRSIYKFHAITRQWGDIGYNYLIGEDGEIYEGRAGGDYVVAAHDKWNNRSTVGIALIGNYDTRGINEKQYDSLKKLTTHLINKYDIDMTEKTAFHRECIGDDCIKVLESDYMYPIIGHRDAGHTDCPGDELYNQLDDLRWDILSEPKWVAKLQQKKVFRKLEKFEDHVLIDILAKVESQLDKKHSNNKYKLKTILLSYFEYKNKIAQNPQLTLHSSSEIENKSIKIKLSYPNSDKITIVSGGIPLNIKRVGDKISIKGNKYNMLKIPKKDPDSILEISSWERTPSWDKEGKYNDNKFRGDMYVYSKNNKLVVVNSLPIEEYLKGLGEVSDFENPEKVRTIITAARTYATWYTNKARKFPGEFYDGSDDPNVFQKYLGYSLEVRSPNINKIVEETKGQLITYNGEIIKPWYFSSSNGQTMSFFEYCSVRYDDVFCSDEAKKYPYLQSVVDEGGKGQKKSGHGVGISGTGVSYFAEKGWTYDMIIKYFLKGVEVL